MSGSIFLPAAYLLTGIFAAAFAWRVLKMARLPVHLRWELAPIPHEKGRNRYGGSYFEEYEWWTKKREKSLFAEFKYMFLEIAFLRGVWENQRGLWRFSFPFHFGLYLLIGAGGLLLLGAAVGLAGIQVGGRHIFSTATMLVAGAGYACGAVGAVGLSVQRRLDPKLHAFTTPVMRFNLLLTAAVFISGAWALWATPNFYSEATALMRNFLTGNSRMYLPAPVAVHVLLVLLFAAYLPFTQMMHFAAKYFTYHEIRWNDQPMTPGSRMERETQQLLKQPVTWAAPHLNADGKKNWVDIASEEQKK